MNYYSKATGEHINTANPADWMGQTEKPVPAHDKATSSAIFKDSLGDWEIVFAVPVVIVPETVTRRQGRLALLDVGKLDAVEADIDAIADPEQKRKAQIEYETDTWERGNPFLQSMWTQLGGTEIELDGLFILANTK